MSRMDGHSRARYLLASSAHSARVILPAKTDQGGPKVRTIGS